MRYYLYTLFCLLLVVLPSLGQTVSRVQLKGDTLPQKPSKSHIPYRYATPSEAAVVAVQIGGGLTLGMLGQDTRIQAMTRHYLKDTRVKWDDYTQLAPLALTYALRLSGKPFRSEELSGMKYAVTAHLLTLGISTLATQGTKRIVGRLRPDGGNYHSFPSGHTATAFLSAAILDAEYGEQYPWLAATGYGVAALTGIGRRINERHWATDVTAGAAVGIASAYLGYWLSDLIYGHEHISIATTPDPHSSYIAIENGRSNLVSTDSYTLALLLRARMTKGIGLALEGQLGSHPQIEGTAAQSHAALAGVSYVVALPLPSLWIEGRALVGGIGLQDGSIEAQRTALLKGQVSLHFAHRATLSTRLGLGYMAAPWGQPSMQGWQATLGISYLIKNSRS